MKKYCLRYKFHVITVNMEEKSVEQRECFFEHFEDLLKCYREKKNAKAYGFINYNTDFEVFTVEFKQQDIKKLDELL